MCQGRSSERRSEPFTQERAGVSPKKFLQYITLNRAKSLLITQPKATLLEASDTLGLSSTSRLHDLFVNIEAMTPATYKNGGKHLSIDYEFSETPFGRVLLASTDKGICHINFDKADNAINALQQLFPQARIKQQHSDWQQRAARFFQSPAVRNDKICLHLKGTPFQLKVWEALLHIPAGKLSSYGDVARAIAQPSASRAVGTAIGQNPVAFLIPCHRVIRSSGALGGYRWGLERKAAMIGWEAARLQD
ncbi:MAG: cysteine methyltransferase [Gammaproteobacteria bacterium]|nr:MAG: cysteine methyltransferase [Gammaproteobacteria bacterium]